MLIIDLLILILMSEYNTENKVSRESGYNGRVEGAILPRGCQSGYKHVLKSKIYWYGYLLISYILES
jgi:hypothetical protein